MPTDQSCGSIMRVTISKENFDSKLFVVKTVQLPVIGTYLPDFKFGKFCNAAITVTTNQSCFNIICETKFFIIFDQPVNLGEEWGMFTEKDSIIHMHKTNAESVNSMETAAVGKCLWLTRSGKISKFSLPERINSCLRDNIRSGKGVFGYIKY